MHKALGFPYRAKTAAPAPIATSMYMPIARSPMLNRDLCTEGIAREELVDVPEELEEEPVEVDPAVAVAATALTELAADSLAVHEEAVVADLMLADPLKLHAESEESWP